VTGSALAVGPPRVGEGAGTALAVGSPAAVPLDAGTGLTAPPRTGTGLAVPCDAGTGLAVPCDAGTVVETLGTGRGFPVPANAAADKPPATTTATAPNVTTTARVDLRMSSPAKKETLSQVRTREPRSGWLLGCDPQHS
jgi:hypothetical protein